jgi:hypothetical protein
MAHCRGCLWIRRRSASIELPVQPKFQRIIDAQISTPPKRAVVAKAESSPWCHIATPTSRVGDFAEMNFIENFIEAGIS